MCMVRMDNKWIGLDTALQVQALLFEMQFIMWTRLLSEWLSSPQKFAGSFPCSW